MSLGFNRLPRPDPEVRTGLAPNGRAWESVWSYPRPPEVRSESRAVLVSLCGEPVASSERAIKVCETAGGPVIYLPIAEVEAGALRPASDRGSHCEWKGAARYFDVVAGDQLVRGAAWTYPCPSPGFEVLTDHVAFYPGLVECHLDGERVRPQAGGFYGGWITDEITGPVKGAPGSEGW